VQKFCRWIIEQDWDDLGIPYDHLISKVGWEPEYMYDAGQNSIHRWLGAALDAKVLEWWMRQVKNKTDKDLPGHDEWWKWFCYAYSIEPPESWEGK
jgi:hypothetical protein